MVFPQLLLDTHDELIVDLFAGGGGASVGIELATGRQVDVAVNHDAQAVKMHEANHPQTLHLQSDVFEVCPRRATDGRPVGLLWASPDCTYHSKARGSKPIRHANKKRRALAWVVTRWAGQVAPRVIMLENVEEFAQWGPLRGKSDALKPCQKRRGKTFRRWVRSLRDHGYAVEWRELRACDYGAPTIRKRLFVIARRDGRPIVWPEPTHGPGRKHPYRTAAECIDWSIPMCSIFATKDESRAWAKFHKRGTPQRPLAPKTLRRIARGVKKFVIDNPKPFFVTLSHGDESPSGKKRWGEPARSMDQPIGTLQCSGSDAVVAPVLTCYHDEKNSPVRAARLDGLIPTLDCSNRFGLVAPFLVPRYGEAEGQDPRSRTVEAPSPVIVPGGNGGQLAAAFLSQFNDGFASGNSGDGRPLSESVSTVSTKGPHQAVIAAHIQRDFGTSTGSPADAPIGTITTEGGGHAALVASLLAFYGTDQDASLEDPLPTVTTKDRFALVTVDVKGEPFVVVDIMMRMLAPKELYLCQGFPPGYVFDRTADGKPITATDAVRMCGNSVCPPVAEAMARANCSDLSARPERELIRSTPKRSASRGHVALKSA